MGYKEDINADLEVVRNGISMEAGFLQLAEEASELSAAAAKVARIIEGSNPTPVSFLDGMEDLLEEFADVLTAAGAVSVYPDTVHGIIKAKAKRWRQRVGNNPSRNRKQTKYSWPGTGELTVSYPSDTVAKLRYTPNPRVSLIEDDMEPPNKV